MNRYLGNICISAVSAVAGGTIAHLTDAQIIKNLENQNEKLEEKNIKYKLHIIKLNKIISYYETKYNEKVEITVDGQLYFFCISTSVLHISLSLGNIPKLTSAR